MRARPGCARGGGCPRGRRRAARPGGRSSAGSPRGGPAGTQPTARGGELFGASTQQRDRPGAAAARLARAGGGGSRGGQRWPASRSGAARSLRRNAAIRQWSSSWPSPSPGGGAEIRGRRRGSDAAPPGRPRRRGAGVHQRVSCSGQVACRTSARWAQRRGLAQQAHDRRAQQDAGVGSSRLMGPAEAARPPELRRDAVSCQARHPRRAPGRPTCAGPIGDYSLNERSV